MNNTGGVHWELGEARKDIIAAQQSGDLEAETLGWMRLADALVNAAGEGAARQLAPMLKALREAREEAKAARNDRKTDAIVSEHNQTMLIDQAELVQAELGRHAARLGIVEMRMAESETTMHTFALAKAVSMADFTLMAAQLELLSERVTRLEAPPEEAEADAA